MSRRVRDAGAAVPAPPVYSVLVAGKGVTCFECVGRIGEAYWLTWDDVELDTDGGGGFLHVRAKPGEWKPKDRDDRKLPLHPRVTRILARRPRTHRFVFTARASREFPKGNNQISDRHALTSLKSTLKRLGIREGSLHSFRRFFISFAANNGVEPFKPMRWVGHSDLETVLRYYRLGDDESIRAMNGLPFDGPRVIRADLQKKMPNFL